MPLAFYTFAVSLIGGIILLSLHIFEIKKGEIQVLEKMRESSDRFILSQIRFWTRTYKKGYIKMKEHAPDIARKIVRGLRKDNIKIQFKRLGGYIAKGIHDGLVYILRFFGKLRKRTGELAEKNLKKEVIEAQKENE